MALYQIVWQQPVMHTETAFARRDTLSDNELERLRMALVDEVDRYLPSIRGYSPEKMERFGKPFLEKLQARVIEVERQQKRREESN